MEGGEVMIVVSFWTLNPGVSPSKVAEVYAKLLEKEVYPAKHTKTLAWYICPGGKGVTISEIEGAYAGEDTFEDWMVWARELPGIFGSFETLPALTAEKAAGIVLK
jgi:hypothetical protein